MQVKEGGEWVEWNIFLQLDFMKEHFLNYTKKYIYIYILKALHSCIEFIE